MLLVYKASRNPFRNFAHPHYFLYPQRNHRKNAGLAQHLYLFHLCRSCVYLRGATVYFGKHPLRIAKNCTWCSSGACPDLYPVYLSRADYKSFQRPFDGLIRNIKNHRFIIKNDSKAVIFYFFMQVQNVLQSYRRPLPLCRSRKPRVQQ